MPAHNRRESEGMTSMLPDECADLGLGMAGNFHLRYTDTVRVAAGEFLSQSGSESPAMGFQK